jgi:hypothetical protein
MEGRRRSCQGFGDLFHQSMQFIRLMTAAFIWEVPVAEHDIAKEEMNRR